MQQLNLLETPVRQNGTTAVWATLNSEQRAIVIAALARLIAKLVASRRDTAVAAEKEKSHD